MKWETPSFTEIDMSAEIGAYQGDFDQERQGDDGGRFDGLLTNVPTEAK
jgi:coenzyme PQQ precursor peptide PqqA